MRSLNTVLCLVLAACETPAPETSQSLKTVIVSGTAYDVVFDPYAPSKAIIYGRPSLVLAQVPKEEIIAAGAPCPLDANPFVFEFSSAPHPTNSDLIPLAVAQLDCSDQ